MFSSDLPVRRSRSYAMLLLLGVAALFLLLPVSVHATVFDWPTGGWTMGAPGPGQTFTESFTSINPNDISVSFNNNGAGPQGGTWRPGYPTIDSTTSTGGFSGVNGLQMFLNQQSTTSSFILTTVVFSTTVTNLSFQIWDVDAISGTFADKIYSLQALGPGGVIVGATSVTSATPGFNTITGSGLSTVVLGTATADNATNQGTITITFAGPITQFSFKWSNNDPALSTQAIALGPLTYVATPEMSPGWGAALVCAIAIGSREISRRRRMAWKKQVLAHSSGSHFPVI